VSILGSEGKGKSTILNALFDTEFVVAEGRDEARRKTNGVDVAVVNDLIILEVEGLDCSSIKVAPLEEVKGERHIEDKLALFVSLETDLVIINLMASDFGAYQASGMRTLETIFKATKQLRYEKQLRAKKQLLFFVRDVETKTIGAIAKTIMSCMQEVYTRAGIKESEISDMIDIGVIPFPHYEHCRDAFDAKVREVRPLFTKQNMFSQLPAVPAQFIPKEYRAIWRAVLTNKRLFFKIERTRGLRGKVLQREMVLRETALLRQVLEKVGDWLLGGLLGLGVASIVTTAIAFLGPLSEEVVDFVWSYVLTSKLMNGITRSIQVADVLERQIMRQVAGENHSLRALFGRASVVVALAPVNGVGLVLNEVVRDLERA
jgi:hypothetical protein